MEILAIGTEIVDCARIAGLIQKHGEDFLRSVFTPREISYCSRRSLATQQYAARWAAKQAVLKALALVPNSDFAWCDMEIRGSLRSGLSAVFFGRLRRVCQERQVTAILVTATHSRLSAAAFAVALGKSAS